MTKYAYCNICKKQIEEPSRKPMETFHKVLWVLLCIASLGIGLIVFAIYMMNKPKQYCPTCATKLKFSKEPFVTEKEEDESIPRTPKEKVLKKAGKEIPPKKKTREKEEAEEEPEGKEKIDDTFCPFCGEDVSSSEKRCPYCGSKL